MKILDPLAFALAAVRHVAPDEVLVDAAANVDAAGRMPLVIVQTTAPLSVRNGPNAAANTLRIVVSTHAESRGAASDLARSLYAGLLGMWRGGVVTAHGAFVHISNDSQLPHLVDSGLVADDIHRFDFTLNAVVRPL